MERHDTIHSQISAMLGANFFFADLTFDPAFHYELTVAPLLVQNAAVMFIDIQLKLSILS